MISLVNRNNRFNNDEGILYKINSYRPNINVSSYYERINSINIHRHIKDIPFYKIFINLSIIVFIISLIYVLSSTEDIKEDNRHNIIPYNFFS